jgi:hypothetical protein
VGSEASGAVAQPAENVTATHAIVALRIRIVGVVPCLVTVSVSPCNPCYPWLVELALPVVLLDAVERLDDVVDRGDVDLCGAWLGVAACVTVGAAAGKADLLDTLALIRRE